MRLPRRLLERAVVCALALSIGTTLLFFAMSGEADGGTPVLALRHGVAAATRRLLPCRDADAGCAAWAEAGECAANSAFMNVSCRRACKLCRGGLQRLRAAVSRALPAGGTPNSTNLSHVDPDCADKSSFCGEWAAVGECDSNPNYMRAQCKVTCHLCQSAACHDLEPARCAAQAARGECRTDPERMHRECRWACRWCAMDTSARCRRDPALRPAATPGSTHYMFRRASSALHARYAPKVLSREPWVVQFDDFLSAAEADAMIRVGEGRWARSVAGDGVQAVRTSSTAWCDAQRCGARGGNPLVAAVRERIANLTLVPMRNAEHLQVLRYEEGQFYRLHHDQNSPPTSAWGPRLYTFFMYLNDGVQGGSTHFPQLNLSVQPRRGRAVLWPSVLDADPNARDGRTEHESQVVTGRAAKYAANYWLHLYDFEAANDRRCGNSEVFGNW